MAKRLRVDNQLFDDATVPEDAVREVMVRVVQQIRDIGVMPSCRFFPDRVEETHFKFERGKVVWTCVACNKLVTTTGTSASSMQAIKRWPSILHPDPPRIPLPSPRPDVPSCVLVNPSPFSTRILQALGVETPSNVR